MSSVFLTSSKSGVHLGSSVVGAVDDQSSVLEKKDVRFDLDVDCWFLCSRVAGNPLNQETGSNEAPCLVRHGAFVLRHAEAWDWNR